MSDIVQKLWGFCHTLRHDGIDYGDYIEQITYLLFIKMADERSVKLPEGCDWKTLIDKSGTDLTDHYSMCSGNSGRSTGLLGDIFAGALSRFSNPVNLKKLIGLIDETEWTELNIDVKGEAFEGLLEKAASEGKKGAGPVLHAAYPDPVDCPVHEARSPEESRFHDLRSRVRYRRVPGLLVRVAAGADEGRGT